MDWLQVIDMLCRKRGVSLSPDEIDAIYLLMDPATPGYSNLATIEAEIDKLAPNKQETAMQKYRKKPVVIQAVRFTGAKSAASVLRKINADIGSASGKPAAYLGTSNDHLVIPTLEGDHRADIGDWVIKDVAGEFYPCKPDIFAATYEKVAA